MPGSSHAKFCINTVPAGYGLRVYGEAWKQTKPKWIGYFVAYFLMFAVPVPFSFIPHASLPVSILSGCIFGVGVWLMNDQFARTGELQFGLLFAPILKKELLLNLIPFFLFFIAMELLSEGELMLIHLLNLNAAFNAPVELLHMALVFSISAFSAPLIALEGVPLVESLRLTVRALLQNWAVYLANAVPFLLLALIVVAPFFVMVMQMILQFGTIDENSLRNISAPSAAILLLAPFSMGALLALIMLTPAMAFMPFLLFRAILKRAPLDVGAGDKFSS